MGYDLFVQEFSSRTRRTKVEEENPAKALPCVMAAGSFF